MTAPEDWGKSGGPAFPHDVPAMVVKSEIMKDYPELFGKVDVILERYGGLSKRQYYAAKALQGLLASNQLKNREVDIPVALAFKYADAMLAAERETGK